MKWEKEKDLGKDSALGLAKGLGKGLELGLAKGLGILHQESLGSQTN